MISGCFELSHHTAGHMVGTAVVCSEVDAELCAAHGCLLEMACAAGPNNVLEVGLDEVCALVLKAPSEEISPSGSRPALANAVSGSALARAACTPADHRHGPSLNAKKLRRTEGQEVRRAVIPPLISPLGQFPRETAIYEHEVCNGQSHSGDEPVEGHG